MTQRYLRYRLLRHGVGTIFATGMALFAYQPASSAATITVNAHTEVSGDGKCSFEEAVSSMNDAEDEDGCTSTGTYRTNDTINIPASSSVYTIAIDVTIYNPTDLTISGAGASSTVLQFTTYGAGYSYTGIEALTYGTAALTIQNLTLQGGKGNQDLGLDNEFCTTLTLTGVRVTGFANGGLKNEDVLSMTVNNSTIDDNGGDASVAGGGFENQGSLTINNSTISGNVGFHGGAIDSSGFIFLSGSTLDSNVASSGGGLYIAGHNGAGTYARLNMHNCTITNNSTTSGAGGGIFWDGGASGGYFEGALNTIVNNHSQASGGGLFVAVAGGGIVEFGDSIIANNSAAQSGPDILGDMTFFGKILVSSSAGISNIPSGWIIANPLLGQYGSINALPKVFALLPGSPAIDAGPADEGYYVDERGFPRPLSGTGLSSVVCDLGAFEYDPWQTEHLTVAGKSSDSHTIVTDPTYSTGQGTWLHANATGDYVTYAVPVPVSGTYAVSLRGQRAKDGGQFQVSIASSLNGTYTKQGAVQELYSSTTNFYTANLGNVTATGPKTYYYKFAVTGKNGSSSGYNIRLDYIFLTKQ